MFSFLCLLLGTSSKITVDALELLLVSDFSDMKDKDSEKINKWQSIKILQILWWPNQIKSNHFYCHITTAQVPWWVKFLWACSRQCRKTTDNLHMDRQCKKLHWSIYSAPDSAKKKKTTAIYIWTVHIYRLYRRHCAKYTYIYSVRLVYYKDIHSYQLHIIHRMGTSTLCTVSIHNVVYT